MYVTILLQVLISYMAGARTQLAAYVAYLCVPRRTHQAVDILRGKITVGSKADCAASVTD